MFGGATQRIWVRCGNPPHCSSCCTGTHATVCPPHNDIITASCVAQNNPSVGTATGFSSGRSNTVQAEKVSSLGKDWHKLCLKCDRCNKLLNAGGHAEHDGRPYCHKPCYAALFGPKGVNIGGAGSYVYDTPANNNLSSTSVDSASKAEEKRVWAPKAPSKAAGSITTFSGEANLCPRCNKKVYFAEKVTSLGKDWHRPCLRCERCSKTLSAGSHAEHDGQPYCHKPCYAVLFGPKGVNTGGVGSYIYDKEPSAVTQP